MDPLTHTLFGASLAETGLRHRTRFATATLVVGANLPDLDVLAYARGADFALGFRRGWTHGVLALVLLPLVWTVLVALWARWRGAGKDVDLRWILGLSSLAVLSHPVLDWLNVYGIRWLMPFDGRWFYGDAVFIVDPWLWLALAVPVLLARSSGRWAAAGWFLLAALTSAAVLAAPRAPAWAVVAWFSGLAVLALLRLGPGSAGGPLRPRPAARAVLALVVLYAFGMLATSRIARTEVRSHLEATGTTGEATITVLPVAFRSLERDVVVSDERGHRFGSWTPGNLELETAIRPRGEDHPAVAPARAAPCLQGFLTWTRLPYWSVDAVPGGGWVVTVLDARYVARSEGAGPGDFGTDRIGVDASGEPVCENPRSPGSAAGN